MDLFEIVASDFKPFLIFGKSFILIIWLSPDIWLSLEYVSASVEKQMFYHIERDEKKIVLQLCFLLAIFFTYIFSTSLKFGACYITGQWGKFRIKNVTLCLHILLWHFVVVFYQKICVFIIFICLPNEVSNFRNKILSNLKPELVIRSCQWNCMHNIEI